jgi:hypothetical protein
MKAELWTRCGCKREMLITFPPPPEIFVPLRYVDTVEVWTAQDKPGPAESPSALLNYRVFERELGTGTNPWPSTMRCGR